MAFICQTCGKEHQGLPLDVGFDKPLDYIMVPEIERGSRCELTPDHCIIDCERFFLRGCLSVPVHDLSGHFVWGMWAEVSGDVFRRYLELHGADGSREPPVPAKMSGEPRGYRGLDGHPLLIQFGPADKRPQFILQESDHLMYREQQSGITQHRVHEILDEMFPDGY
jgi:hypothetical protein